MNPTHLETKIRQALEHRGQATLDELSILLPKIPTQDIDRSLEHLEQQGYTRRKATDTEDKNYAGPIYEPTW